MFEMNDFQKIGVGLVGFGITFLFLGVLLVFDKGLLAIGNILFITGLSFIIGLQRTFWFFFEKHKLKSSGFFFTGIFLVLLGWPIVGILLEAYGFILLFKGFLPAALAILLRIPVLGTILNLPIISTIVDKLGGDASRSMV